MRILRKIMIILIVGILLFSITGIFQNKVYGATYLINKADLYSKGEMISFRYKDILVGVQFVVYKKDGIEYPAYCLDKNLIGVTVGQGVEITVNKALEDVKIWRVITNGYPFKTPKELNCNSEMEAFAATKMAVYDTMYNYDWSDFTATNEQGKRVIKAAEKIATTAKKSTAVKISGKVEIIENSKKWKQDELDKNYISKVYKVCTNAESTEYSVEIENLQIDGFKITDESNNEKSKFKNGENFKILLPISELNKKGEIGAKLQIEATADLRTKPVLYGETPNSNYQNYAVAGGEWEFENGKLIDTYPNNKTCIEIVKQDTKTGKKLEGAKFNILDENNNILYADIVTNIDGIVKVEGLMPGKYFIEEIQAPNGYTKYDEKIEIDIDFNEIYTVNVGNYEKPQEEDGEVENKKEINVTGKKEKLLPRTGY